MGYEVIYHYHERKDGKYNTEEVKKLKKKIGDMYDEPDRNRLALAILGQFARRDIMVIDVEVFEYTKKKINFKEVEGGIKIGSKKYKLSETATLVTEEESVAPQLPSPVAMLPAPTQTNGSRPLYPHEIVQQQNGTRKPIKFVRYEPTGHQEFEAKRKQLKLTTGRMYPVFSEKEKKNAIGEFDGYAFRILDDVGREIDIGDEYFVPPLNLVGDKEVGFSKQPNLSDSNLSWSGIQQESGSMIDIRKRG